MSNQEVIYNRLQLIKTKIQEYDNNMLLIDDYDKFNSELEHLNKHFVLDTMRDIVDDLLTLCE